MQFGKVLKKSSVLGNQISLNPANVKTPSECVGSSAKTNLVLWKMSAHHAREIVYISWEVLGLFSGGLPNGFEMKSCSPLSLLRHTCFLDSLTPCKHWASWIISTPGYSIYKYNLSKTKTAEAEEKGAWHMASLRTQILINFCFYLWKQIYHRMRSCGPDRHDGCVAGVDGKGPHLHVTSGSFWLPKPSLGWLLGSPAYEMSLKRPIPPATYDTVKHYGTCFGHD